MRVLITGGNGLIGQVVAQHLLQRGFEVHLTDLTDETQVPHTTYARCDVTRYDEVVEQARGCDAVVHMAALRGPMHDIGPIVYHINTVGTFNVFEAAAQVGIRRVVQASSINAIGCAWNSLDFVPAYFPIDEDHPSSTSDPYSLSKHHSESIADYYWRRARITSIALRLPGVYLGEAHKTEELKHWRTAMCRFLDDFRALPQDEQHHALGAVRARTLKLRAAKGLEYPATSWPVSASLDREELLWRAYMIDRFNLWASVDVRDAARAVEQALMADYEGSHALFINEALNSLNYDAEALVRLFFPDITQRRRPFVGGESLVSIERARALIGFDPLYSLHGAEDAANR